MIFDGTLAIYATKESITDQMEESPFTFYLGGSHFFGCARPDSDYDFLTQDVPGVVEWLESLGFVRVGGVEYAQPALDDNTRGVYQLNNVQVQVHFELWAALIARDILSQHFAEEHKEVRGEPRSRMWESCIKLAKGIRQIHASEALPAPF